MLKAKSKHIIQPKLKVGNPRDKYEQEANRVADTVMRKPDGQVQRQTQDEDEEMVQMQSSGEEEELQMQAMDDEEEQLQMQPMEEEEELQMKSANQQSDGQGTFAPEGISQQLQSSRGAGESLSPGLQREMTQKMGSDFSNVAIHTDSKAVQMNEELGAKAFTHGSDIYFNQGQYNPESSKGKHLLAHELTHVVQQNGAGERVAKQGLLTPAQEQAAINYNNLRYDLRSIMIIQNIVGSNQDGIMGPLTVEAIATFQNTNGLTVDGKVGPNTLEQMFQNRVAATLHEHAIQLVVDFHNLDLSDTLTITHDPSLLLTLATTTFEPGGLRVIRLGLLSFLSADFLKSVIETELAIAAPAVAPGGPRPTHLNAAEEQAAIRYNQSKYTTGKAIRGMQGLVGTPADGIFGQDTVERIADYQHGHGLTVDGMTGEDTLRQMVADLDARMQQNVAIHLIMDFYNMSTFDALLDISYDHNLTTSNASTGGIIPGPSTVRIGRPGFSRGFEALVHTIAHELEHVRQRKEGILNRNVREFLGEAIEIISENMPEENVAGFFSDARRALRHWNSMPVAEQRTHWARFEEVRNQVRRRHGLATAAEQATHQPTLDAYNAIAEP
ncbi:DUF4157 domain-containing protein [Aliifodinibius sp. S!AR15-10]|uniref:eCIS core domain-containing protein n=1 Tax=Aliifodinibius sp. S!AR15-10 TaxID=2950437 RepID=UPI0028708A88|nr:DUF4157 domain-containing protein [Aliifodinibius sp. S!AR15-10]